MQPRLGVSARAVLQTRDDLLSVCTAAGRQRRSSSAAWPTCARELGAALSLYSVVRMAYPVYAVLTEKMLAIDAQVALLVQRASHGSIHII